MFLNSKMKTIYITFLLLLLFSVSQAQINTLFEGDSSKIIGITPSSGYCHKVTNLDNDYYWSCFGGFYFNYDDDLDIIDTVNIGIDFEYKFQNKFYSLLYSYHIGIIPIDSVFGIPYAILDSINILSYDITNNNLTYHNVDTTAIISLQYYYLMLKNRDGLFAVASLDTNIGLRLSIIDVMGNVVRSNTFNTNAFMFNIAEQGNNIIISSKPYYDRPTLYYVDINSLLIVDSMESDIGFINLKGVNDSIMVGTYWGNMRIYNTNAKTTDLFGVNSQSYEGLPTHIPDWNIGGRCSDSLIFCYRRSTYDNIHSGVVVSNFNHLGLPNYEYVFNDFEPNGWKLIHGIHTTNDGGVIMNINTKEGYTPNSYSNAYLLKFYPNGRLSLASVEPDKTAIILYPNPTKDFINIVSSDEIKEITIYNSLSQNVYSKKHKGKDIELNVSNFSKGNYIADIKTEKGNIRKKFIVD